MDDKQVIAWAHNELRDMDELCRSQVPGYAPFDSQDMQTLARLKELAGDADAQPVIDHEPLLDKIENYLHKASMAFQALDFKSVRDQINSALALVVNREKK